MGERKRQQTPRWVFWIFAAGMLLFLVNLVDAVGFGKENGAAAAYVFIYKRFHMHGPLSERIIAKT